MATVKHPEVWDLDVFFKGGSESPEFHQFLNDLLGKVESAVTKIQALAVQVSASELRDVLNQFTNVLMEISHAGGMLSCLTAQNTKDTTALLLQGQLSTISASFAPATLRLQQLLSEIDATRFNELIASPEINEFTFILTEWREQAKQKLSEQEEALISALGVDGYSSYFRLTQCSI